MTKSNQNKRGTSAVVVDSTQEKAAAEAVAVVEAVRVEWNGLSATTTEVSRRVADATYAAVQAGLIGKDKPLGTMEAYAATFTNPGSGEPYTKSQGYSWSRVGKARAYGMSEADQRLVSSLWSQCGSEFDKATSVTALRKILRSAVAASKAGKGNGNTAKGKPAKKGATPPAPKPDMPRNNSGRIDRMTELANALTKPSKAERARLAELIALLQHHAGVAPIPSVVPVVRTGTDG